MSSTAASRLAAAKKKNLCILGPPGSGKGFYGRPIASYFQLTFFTASDILRQRRPDLDLTSGKLVDDETVSDAVLDHFREHNTRHFLLDGFPRTFRQVELMERYWPIEHQVHYAVHLDVPDGVCQQKMIGRRKCSKCKAEYNTANVQTLGFDLPPQMPKEDNDECAKHHCNHDTDWTRRDDDILEIVQERLRVHREHETPIVNFYKSQGRLLTFTPFRGELDIPRLQWTLESWLKTFD